MNCIIINYYDIVLAYTLFIDQEYCSELVIILLLCLSFRQAHIDLHRFQQI